MLLYAVIFSHYGYLLKTAANGALILQIFIESIQVCRIAHMVTHVAVTIMPCDDIVRFVSASAAYLDASNIRQIFRNVSSSRENLSKKIQGENSSENHKHTYVTKMEIYLQII